MYNDEQEQRKLTEENQARLFYFISHHVFQMNQLLKCCICFDVFEKPTTVFHCFHVFCETCIKTYLDFSTTKEPPCPICQKPIPRNDLRPNNALAKIAEFVSFAHGQIYKTLGCDVSKPSSFEAILTKIKENKNTKISLQTKSVKPINTPPPDYSLILKARKILITPNNEVISTVEELPREIPSVSFRDGSLKTPTLNRRNSVAIQPNRRNSIAIQSLSANKNKDLFDYVKESPVANPFFKRNRLDGVTKTYSVRKQPNIQNRANTFADKIIQFEDDSNKIKIIQWLNDSRNTFDSRPLTQQQNDPESQSQFDMPSISQIHRYKINPVSVPPPVSQIKRQKEEQNKIREKSELVTHLSRIDFSARNKQHKTDNRRTHSLENDTKTAKPNHKLKRHSISAAENIIEQFNSEDEFICKENFGNPAKTIAIVNLIEEECLKNIEAEVLQQTMQNKFKILAKKTKRPAEELISPKRSKRLISKSVKIRQMIEKPHKKLDKNSSGWNRMKEIRKTIGKVELKPKKLNISGISRCSSTITSITKEPEGSKKETKKLGKGKNEVSEPVVILERMNIGDVKSKNNAYDLDILESYFSKNLADNEMLQKEVVNKNETLPGSSCTVGNSSSKKGSMKSKSPNKLLVSAIIHNTDRDKAKDNSNNVKALKVEKEKLKFKGEESKHNSKQAEKANVASTPIGINKTEEKKSKLMKDESNGGLDRITKAADYFSTSTFKSKIKGVEPKNDSKQVEKDETSISSSVNNKTDKEKPKSTGDESKTSLDQKTKVSLDPITKPSLDPISKTSLDRFTKTADDLSTSTLKSKFKNVDPNNDSKQLEEDETSIPSSVNNKTDKEKPKSTGDESKTSLDRITKPSLDQKTKVSLDPITKPSLDPISKTSLEQFTKTADDLSTSTLKSKFKNVDPKNDSKQLEEDETSIPSSISEKEKSKSMEDESRASLIQAKKTTQNLSTSALKSRKKLFDDDKSENLIIETINEKEKSLINRKTTYKPKKKINKLSLSPSTFVKGKSMEEKSKLEFQKFAEEVVEIISKTSKNPITRIDTDLKNNSTLFGSHHETKMDDDDDIFMKPTQVLFGKEKANQENIMADDEIFTMATQVVTINDTQDNSLESTLKHKIQSLHNIFNKPYNIPNLISKIKMVLKDIKETISKEESQHEPTTCKLKNDAQIQTDFKEISFISHNATTQTVSPGEKIKHAAIQTDSCDTSRGFRISSTELFNTRPIAHSEMQTDAMACPKCNFVWENNSKTTLLNNPTAISSEALLRDSNIIKNLSEKYVLSESFDHIDFETQDVIKGKDIKRSSTLLKNSKVQNEQNKENDSRNKIENKQSPTFKKLNENKSPQNSKPAPNVVLTSQSCNKSPSKKPYKRIRKPSSDSDSDEGLPKNVKKNKFIQDDLSLHFASELQKEITQPACTKIGKGDEFLLSGESEGIDYGEYLQNVLKNCDEDLMAKTSAPRKKTMAVEPPPKRSKTQDIIEECKLILQEACSGAITIENTENITIARQDIPKPTKLTLAALEEEFQHNFSDDGKDDIMEIDEDCTNATNFGIQPLENKENNIENRNKFSESLFLTADNFSKSIGNVLIPESEECAHLEAHEKSKNGNKFEKEKIEGAANQQLSQSHLDELADFGIQPLGNKEKNVENRNKFSESLFSTADNFSKSIGNVLIPESEESACLEAHEKSKNKNKFGKEKIEGAANRQLAQSHLDELADVLDEFNESFGDNINAEEKSLIQNKNDTAIRVEDKTLTEQPRNLNNDNNKDRVKILQNIVIAKNNLSPHHGGSPMGNTKKKTETIVDEGNESDDMFLSDSDVVETTPQKNKPVSLEKLSFLSQAYYNPEEKIILPPLQDESPDIISSLDPAPFTGLGEVFMPPPEFQDTPNDETLVDKEVTLNPEKVNLNVEEIVLVDSEEQDEMNQNVPPLPSSSLTPDLILPPINEFNKKEPFVTSTQYSENSQILPSKSLNISPISMKGLHKAINPILAAQKSKVSPLTLLKCKTPPPRRYPLLATSTPKQKSILNYVRLSENENTSFTKSESSPKSVMELTPTNKRPCVACTRMSKEQLLAITSLSNRKLISYSNTFSDAVTHMIVDVNQHNRVKDHTMKFVSAVAAGIWIVNFAWVEECLKQNRLLPEELFEALDMSGIAGPKNSRLMRNTDPLLRGYRIHAAPPFKSTTQKEVESVIKLLGGEVVPRLDDLMPSNGKICLIITEAKDSEDFDMYERWLDMLKVATVDLEWLSRSVGQYERLSLKPFTLCPEESICDLGYPAELLTDMPVSFSHTM